VPKVKVKNDELTQDLVGKTIEFPKYTTQLMNLANQNAQGTRPKVVGQMSDLIQEFGGKKYDDWVNWYQRKMPYAVDDATEKIYEMVQKLKEAIILIDRDMINKWAKDLILTKTFVGLCFQESILKKVATLKGVSYRLATPAEESTGVDGYIGEKPVSIKPLTYKTKKMYGEQIEADIVYYDKKKDGINIKFNF
jgi:hypothetical protein